MFKIFVILLSAQNTFCANILYLSPVTSPSHHLWNSIFAMGLVNKGHNVTLVDPDKDETPKTTNYSHIFLEGAYEALDVNFNMNDFATYSPLSVMLAYHDWCIFGCSKVVHSQGIQKLLQYPSDFFDLIIIDVTTGSCFYPLIHRFNYPPTIGVTAFLLPSYIAYNFGNQLYPAFVPWPGLPYTTDMTFLERVNNFLLMQLDVMDRNWREYPKEHEIVKEVFGGNIPSMEEIERHMSLILVNTDPVLDYPQPLAPNFISVGGLQTRKSRKLPEDLQVLLDNAKNGVILFSLGTNVRSDKLDNRTQKELLDAFSKLSETVIWKFESDTSIADLPKNVITRKWLPQNDILGHPNVKLFIGHGGALSTQEAFYHGVPIICVPFFLDQYINTRIVVNKKIGLFLDIQRITSEYVEKQIREILDNTFYSENMKKISRIYRDKMETALEKATFWAEFVIRHGGADFLSSRARDMPYYKSSGLDVITFLAAVIIIAIIIVKKLITLVLTLFVGKKKLKVN